MRKTTMRARPVLASYFLGKKNSTFSVQFSNATELDDHISMDQVPDKVLAGWFAHELGHLMDYLHRSMVEMIVFGIRYALSHNYRKRVEHKADEYAIDYGLAEEILTTKRFILEHSHFSEDYKNRIRRYYMSVRHVKLLWRTEGFEEIQPDDANILDPNP